MGWIKSCTSNDIYELNAKVSDMSKHQTKLNPLTLQLILKVGG